LGGGSSLDKQFDLYHQFEKNTSDGGQQGEQKFNWLKEYSKGRQILFVTFMQTDCKSYLTEIENVKRLNKRFRGKITFVIISTERDENIWMQTTAKYNLFSDGIINYRLDQNAELLKSLQVKETPSFVLIDKAGVINFNSKTSSNPLLEDYFKLLLAE
jgi:thioredoxin-related protein